jgi:NADPH:quinone reductase-like Zn-dependent oxidoreductase
MKAIRFYEYGGPEVTRVDDIPQPEPKPGEFLIRVAAAAVNPIDWKLRTGALKQYMPIQFPFTMGCDVAGTIERGSGKFQPGDEVYGFLLTLRSGAFAEFAIALEGEIALRPKTLSFQEAASVPVAALTAYEALFDRGKLESGQTVLLHGAAGSVGAMAVQLAKGKGARVIGTASAENLDYLRELGADETVDYRNERFEHKAKQVDLVFDMVGGDTLERSFAVVRPGGKLISVAGFPSPELAQEHNIEAKMMGVRVAGPRLAEITQLIDSGRLKTRIDSVFTLENGIAAIARNESGKSKGKVTISVQN